MKANQVHVGGTFVAKVSGQLARVRIEAESPYGGWDATNVTTHRKVRIKSAQRLRSEVSAGPKTCSHCKGEGRFPRCSICGQVYQKPAKDAPAQGVNERASAAPSSIVPDEEPQAPANSAQATEAVPDGAHYDQDRCATSRCKGAPVITHLGRPLCQACWDRHCSEEPSNEISEPSGDACLPTTEQEIPEEENSMSKKKRTKKQSTKNQTMARAPEAKGKGNKKAAKPKAKAARDKKPKRVSALDAAAQVLIKAGKPMGAKDLIAAMAEQDLWTSPAGKTPHATLYAAMLREIAAKGDAARFKKVDRGMFAFNKA